jgi:hypothetical protein
MINLVNQNAHEKLVLQKRKIKNIFLLLKLVNYNLIFFSLQRPHKQSKSFEKNFQSKTQNFERKAFD